MLCVYYLVRLFYYSYEVVIIFLISLIQRHSIPAYIKTFVSRINSYCLCQAWRNVLIE